MAVKPFFQRSRRHKGFLAGFYITKSPIDGRQFGTKAEHGDVNCLTAELAKALFRGLGETAAHSEPLIGWVNRQHSEIAA